MSDRDSLTTLLNKVFQAGGFLGCSLTKLRRKSTEYDKLSLRPIELADTHLCQVTYHYPQKEIHKNLTFNEAEIFVLEQLETVFRQGHFFTPYADWQVLVSKKGVVKILRHDPTRQNIKLDLKHNRTKHYILREGTPYPFLVKLGIMNQSGKVLAKRYHKFRQLNKYLEIIADCLPYLQRVKGDVPLRVVDFGSGKAYLTFALYHYLVEHLGLNVEIIGLDLKADVVTFCNEMVAVLQYEKLVFYQGDIKDFLPEEPIDLVVSLHACDIATDYALAQAVNWQAQVILAVPCCQHELFQQLDVKEHPVLFKHGILKERMAALITDASRAKLLEQEGYSVQVMEFIDLEHTPKNLLIRAFRNDSAQAVFQDQDYNSFKAYWKIEPILERLFNQSRS